MEYINGEFIMVGCDEADPLILHTASDCVNLIHTIGFLPLFSNAIPGFSVEEHVPACQWWTDAPDTDPWLWRQVLSVHPDIAYGKFFGKNAGFISKDWFPTFVNYRRNGYDFDALFEDELASYRAKKIMDVFDLDDESVGKQIMSSEVKQLAGFSKDGGEKNFEGTITDLQMQTYLIIGGFEQKKNKKGVSYGWHIAVMESPETKWGRSYVTSEYTVDPAESWKKIVQQMKRFYPTADESQIQKLLGIKYPGVETAPVKKASKKSTRKTSERKTSRPQELPWPENLITEIGLPSVFPETHTYSPLTDDQMVGLIHVMDTLKENEQTALRLRYEEHKTLQETADNFGLSPERIRQITAKAIKKLRHPTRLMFYRDGFNGGMDAERKRKEDAKSAETISERIKILKQVSIYNITMSVRAMNCLSRAELETLGDVAEIVKDDPVKLGQIRNLGKNSLLEVIEKLEDYGVDCNEVRRVYGFGVERVEDIAELEPSVRLYNILIRAQLDTVEKLEAVIRTEPGRLIRLDGFGRKTAEELFSKLEAIGVDCKPAREEAEFVWGVNQNGIVWKKSLKELPIRMESQRRKSALKYSS